ncbi:hypothetical protein M8231_02900 [Brevundimonas albigilva]|uniref:Uncharacterized protein n=1 Tax=Brevundimonas albigilva TaxID=1312364 RepID=A0ABY4SS95_9CAUL|nr:hypothetical protein [Brevundimonas albigilva]URI15954.1 hypothetical protein M8231_02900 [Brevundimonas albigilva]
MDEQDVERALGAQGSAQEAFKLRPPLSRVSRLGLREYFGHIVASSQARFSKLLLLVDKGDFICGLPVGRNAQIDDGLWAASAG